MAFGKSQLKGKLSLFRGEAFTITGKLKGKVDFKREKERGRGLAKNLRSGDLVEVKG